MWFEPEISEFEQVLSPYCIFVCSTWLIECFILILVEPEAYNQSQTFDQNTKQMEQQNCMHLWPWAVSNWIKEEITSFGFRVPKLIALGLVLSNHATFHRGIFNHNKKNNHPLQYVIFPSPLSAITLIWTPIISSWTK